MTCNRKVETCMFVCIQDLVKLGKTAAEAIEDESTEVYIVNGNRSSGDTSKVLGIVFIEGRRLLEFSSSQLNVEGIVICFILIEMYKIYLD